MQTGNLQTYAFLFALGVAVLLFFMLTMSTLTYIVGWPLLTAVLLAFVPRNYRVIIRGAAVLATLISALLAIKMFLQFDATPAGANGFRFEQMSEWVPSVGISYHVGVDGMNVGLILMGAIVASPRRASRGKSRRAKRNFTSCCW